VTSPPSGQQYELAHGGQRAVIVELGAGLREYDTDVSPLVDGYARDQACDGSRGQLLIPWPNRIAGATYRLDGAEFRLPVNEPRTGSAIHGLARDKPWRLAGSSAAAVTLTFDLPPQDGYPFSLGLSATYSLAGDGLTCQVTATNRGERPCPYGAGAHPYVRVAGSELIDDALLQIPSGATLETDDRGIPTGAERHVEGTVFDFRTPRPIGTLVLDTAFTRLRADEDGVTRITLRSRDGSHGVAVWMDQSHRYAMIYSGDTLPDVSRRRRGLAVEPMTCAPDAFNSGAGLVVLQPGEEHRSTWGIAAL
jgi:galactose mutarotase-like enzyme